MTRIFSARYTTLPVFLALILGLMACSNAANTPTPQTGQVAIDLATNPSPPVSGEVELTVTLADAAGQPVDNAEVYVLAGHTDHSGMNMEGAATAQGNGRYAITADFGMTGDWLVTVEVRGLGAETIRQDFDLSLD